MPRFLGTAIQKLRGTQKAPDIPGVSAVAEYFDPDFYTFSYPGVSGDNVALIEHYLHVGWKIGYDPSPNFSSNKYLNANNDVAENLMNPLVHYIQYGQREGRTTYESDACASYNSMRPKPDSVDPKRPRKRNRDADSIAPYFDFDFYRAGFKLEEIPADPVTHYLSVGWKEGRDPAPWFSTWHYLALHPDVADHGMNPFLHYCISGRLENRRLVTLGVDKANEFYGAHQVATSPGEFFEEFNPFIGVSRKARAKVLAYYLPQFHEIPENNTSWGKGFTEWRNIPRAVARFSGHIQPKIPRDLGYYDLSSAGTFGRQVEMAKAAGIHGFCFYYYSFEGKRVLEKPIDDFLDDQSIDFPFSLIWANENWTRTWDGAERDVILQQSYSAKNDITLIDDLARHMRDRRYIRIEDRPLLFIYRPGHIPDAETTLSRWRELFRDRHALDPLIFMAQGFGDLDPRPYGLDGAIEFPPHKLASNLPPINNELHFFDQSYRGHVLSYDAVVERSLSEPPPDFPLIRCATPNWDNEARRPGRGMILHGSTPQKFGYWLDALIEKAEFNPVFGESFVCINAWNEWAEGAALEPDVHYGAAYLNAVGRSVYGVPNVFHNKRITVLIVGHDAHMNGAQILALSIGRFLAANFGCDVVFILGEDGPLSRRYKDIGRLIISPLGSSELRTILTKLRVEGCSVAITNTTPAGAAVPTLKELGYFVVSLIHELPKLLRTFGLKNEALSISRASDRVIFPAEVVRDGFTSFVGVISNHSEVFPQGLYGSALTGGEGHEASIREEFGLSESLRIVLGVGYADLRKGIDRFVTVALSMCAKDENLAFLWVGAPAGEATAWIQPEIDTSGLQERVRIIGHREDVARFYSAADVFYLSSREDPFPSVVLEALAFGLPVVGHAGCGGCDDLIARHGALVGATDPLAVVGAISTFLKKPSRASAKRAVDRRNEIASNYDFSTYAFGLLQRAVSGLTALSVVVPNYNYAGFIGRRLHSVFDQTYPVREVIVLDDASADDSVPVIRATAEAAGRRIDLHVNDTNSGSPFPQWRRGVELARGDYVWIAEADDLATPDFAARLVARMSAAGSVLGFCDSRQMDEADRPLGGSYRPYINEVEPGAFDTAFDMDGPEFLARHLAVKNVILNVSGVIFRRDALLDAFAAVGEELHDYRVAGDWRLYVELCARGGRVSYLPDVMNAHRRHSTSVTHALKVEKHLAEIARMHEIVREKVGLGEEMTARQSSHLEDCQRHLGTLDSQGT